MIPALRSPFRLQPSTHARLLRAGALSVSAVALMLLLTGCRAEKAASVQPQPVQVAVVEPAPVTADWSYVGTVRPRFETDVGFRVAGKIVERLVDVGQHVEPDQIIMRLDASDLMLAVQSQEAELAAARSSRSQAVAAEERFKALHARGHVAEAALEQRTAAADEARARVERTERALALARNQLAYADLRAAHAGVVTHVHAEVGQVVSLGQPVARLARLDSLEVQVAVPEQMLDAVRAAVAQVAVWGTGGPRLPAELRELSPDADRASRTYQARFSLPFPDQQVRLGRTASLHLSAPLGAERFALPLAAVVNDGRGAAVWMLDASGAGVVRRPVTVTSLSHDRAFVAGALRAGERVVTLGAHMLDAARPVRVVEQRAALR